MIEIGTGQAKGTFVFHKGNPGAAAKILTTLIAGRFSGCDENFEITLFCHIFDLTS